MTHRTVSFGAAIVAGVLTVGVVHASPIDVVLTSDSIDTSFQTVVLAEGIWDIDLRTERVPDSPNWIAWNPFGNVVSGCDGSGANCAQGWFNDYGIKVGENDQFGVNLPRVLYSTPELARDNFNAFALVLTVMESVRFSISDGPDPGAYLDNLGGLSLSLVLRGAPDLDPPPIGVLEPATLTLLGLGLLGIGALRHRRDRAVRV